MRAIDILFNEIDRLNSQIKLEKTTYQKVLLSLKIRKIIDIIEEIDKLGVKGGCGYIPLDFYYEEKDYI